MKRLLLILFAACSGGSRPDAGGSPADAGSTCFEKPMTHFELINGCTTATGIDKQPVLPLLQPDGGLPPLP